MATYGSVMVGSIERSIDRLHETDVVTAATFKLMLEMLEEYDRRTTEMSGLIANLHARLQVLEGER